MIVPDYWAEARRQHRVRGRQWTVRRFGWSDESPEAAQALADARADEALARVVAGERLAPREPKVPYNGAAGVPIREQVVARRGPDVVTRNAYGARCLNTPDVLFADIDHPEGPPLKLGFSLALAVIVAALLIAAAGGARGTAIAFAVVGLMATPAAARALFRVSQRAGGGADRIARRRVDAWVRAHPEANLRLYRTPAGLRVVATHRTYDPRGPEAAALFAALKADPRYVAMCRHQACFRARVSAKPWRIGIERPLRPRPGVWPVDPARRPERDAWLAGYDARAAAWAACALVGETGSGATDPRAAEVIAWHDALAGADRGLPIA